MNSPSSEVFKENSVPSGGDIDGISGLRLETALLSYPSLLIAKNYLEILVKNTNSLVS